MELNKYYGEWNRHFNYSFSKEFNMITHPMLKHFLQQNQVRLINYSLFKTLY